MLKLHTKKSTYIFCKIYSKAATRHKLSTQVYLKPANREPGIAQSVQLLGYGLDSLGFESPWWREHRRASKRLLAFQRPDAAAGRRKFYWGAGDFFSSKLSRPASGPTKYRGSFQETKWPGHDVDISHLVPKVRISGAIPLLPLHAFMTWTRTSTFSRKRKAHYHVIYPPVTGLCSGPVLPPLALSL
jgi:hypothetical protein